MGGRNSKQAQMSFMRDYDTIQENKAENITFLQHKITEEEYMLKQFNFNDKKQCEKVMANLGSLKTKLADNKHVVPLKDYLMNFEDQYCSTFYKIYALFEFPQRTLDDQINQRKLHRKKFTQTELWSILASCIVGLSHLQKNGIKHSALKSSNILLSRQGIVKISDPSALNQHSNYENALTKRQTKHAYLSPEQTVALQQEMIMPQINSYKSDVWTLGVIMLQASFLQYQDEECYRDDKMRVHWETVKYNVNRLGDIYSPQFKNMIEYMLNPDEKARPDWMELEDYVMKGDQNRKSFMANQQLRGSQAIHNGSYTLTTPNQNKSSTMVKSNSPKMTEISVKNAQNSAFPQVNAQMATPYQIYYPEYPIQNLPIVEQQKFSTINMHPTVSNNYSFSNYPPSVVRLPSQSPRVSQTRPQIQALTSNMPGIQSLPPIASQTIINNLGSNSRISSAVNIQPNSHIAQSIPSSTSKYLLPTILPVSTQNLTPVYNQTATISSNSHLNVASNQAYASLPAVKVSYIEDTRPNKNVFPSGEYATKTKIDQNIIIVRQDQPQIDSVIIAKHQVQINRNNGNRQIASYSSSIPQQQHFPSNRPMTVVTQQHSHTMKQELIVPRNQQMIKVQGAPQAQMQTQVQVGPQVQRIHQQTQQQIGNRMAGNGQIVEVFEEFKGGSKYVGAKLNGMRHGYGKFYYQDGGFYDGQWIQNKMSGYGKLYYQSGKLAYDGEWIDDQFTGKGTLYNEQPEPLNHQFDYNNFDQVQDFWIKYEGQFLQDMKNGKGMLYLSNGQKFDGYFIQDCVEGPGTFYCRNGKKVVGNWIKNRKN